MSEVCARFLHHGSLYLGSVRILSSRLATLIGSSGEGGWFQSRLHPRVRITLRVKLRL